MDQSNLSEKQWSLLFPCAPAEFSLPSEFADILQT